MHNTFRVSQKPYNLNATSEPTVDLIEALFVVDTPAKPAVRNQAGHSAMPGRNPGQAGSPKRDFSPPQQR